MTITFEEDGEEYYFDPEDPKHNYEGEIPALAATLKNIEGGAQEIIPHESENPTEYVERERQYSPQKATDMVRSILEVESGVSIIDEEESVDKGAQGPQIVEGPVGNDGLQHYDVEFVLKRIYVDDISEVPQGVDLQTGSRGGLYYDGSSQDFAQAMFDISVNEIENQDEYDYSDEEIENAIQNAQKAEEIAQEAFTKSVNAAQEVGAEIKEAGHRVKGIGSALEKVYNREGTQDKYDSTDDLRDWHGSKVVLDNQEQVHDVFEELDSNEDLMDVNNHFENEKSDPYRAYNVKQEINGVVTELQIMSEEMSHIKTVSHKMLLKPDTAPTEEVDEVPDDYDGDHEMVGPIEDCLTQEADALDGKIDQTEVECDGEAREIITAIFEYEGIQ